MGLMATNKTPGVYIEEIPKLPSSIASVETAIPAFIGYTQKAQERQSGDLLHVPKKISSLLEYMNTTLVLHTMKPAYKCCSIQQYQAMHKQRWILKNLRLI
jgi:phage tail sheath protein FI